MNSKVRVAALVFFCLLFLAVAARKFQWFSAFNQQQLPEKMRTTLEKIKPEEGVIFVGAAAWECPRVISMVKQILCGFPVGDVQPFVQLQSLRYALFRKEPLFALLPRLKEKIDDHNHVALLQLIEQIQNDMQYAENGWSKISEWQTDSSLKENPVAATPPPLLNASAPLELWRYSR